MSYSSSKDDEKVQNFGQPHRQHDISSNEEAESIEERKARRKARSKVRRKARKVGANHSKEGRRDNSPW